MSEPNQVAASAVETDECSPIMYISNRPNFKAGKKFKFEEHRMTLTSKKLVAEFDKLMFRPDISSEVKKIDREAIEAAVRNSGLDEAPSLREQEKLVQRGALTTSMLEHERKALLPNVLAKAAASAGAKTTQG